MEFGEIEPTSDWEHNGDIERTNNRVCLQMGDL